MPRDRSRTMVLAALGVVLAVCTAWFLLGTEQRGDARGSTARIAADASYYHAYLPSLFLDGDLDFTNEYRETGNWYRFGTTPIGRPANVFGVGPAVFEAPLFLLGHGLARITGGRDDGFSELEVKLSLWASVLASVAAMWFAWRLAERRLRAADTPDAQRRWLALAGVFLAFAGGPVVYYAVRQPGYAHPFATLFAAWFVERWDASFDGDGPRGWRTWVAIGGLFGLATLARPQLAGWGVLLVPAVVDDVRRVWRAVDDRGARRARRVLGRVGPAWAAGAGAAFLAILPQLVVWKALYGSFYVVPQGPGFMRWDAPAWSEVLFSSRNGLFPWSPVYAVMAIGLAVACARGPRRLAAWLLAGVAVQVVINGAVWDWWGGGSFGGRRFDSCYVAFALGAAYVVLAPVPRLVRAWRERRARHGALRLGVAAAAVIALELAVVLAVVANLRLAARTSTTTARIHGGEAAARIVARTIDSADGWVASQLSAAASFPARAAFAWRHDTGLDAYDKVVGVYFLGETYPGLNSFQPKTTDTIVLTKVNPVFLQGVVRRAAGVEVLADRARVLIPLNRKGGVRVAVTVAGPAAGPITLAWNDEPIRPATPAAPGAIAGDVAEIERGVNTLEIRAPRGTVLATVTLSALP